MYVRFFASAVVIERISHEWVTAAAKRAKSTVMCVAIDQGGPEFGDARDRARTGTGGAYGGQARSRTGRLPRPSRTEPRGRVGHGPPQPRRRARRRPVSTDPFAALGLPVRNDLTNEQVRAAWRQIAAATHPDRPDGGDVARYTAAASAYDQLRTQWGAARSTPTRPRPGMGPPVHGTVPLPAIGNDVDEIQGQPGRRGQASPRRPAAADPHGPRAAAPAGPARDRRRHPVSRGHAAHRRPARGTRHRHWNHHLVRTHPEAPTSRPPPGR